MAKLGPRIGKEHEEVGNADVWRERFEENASLSLDEVKIRKIGPLALPVRPFGSLGIDINADAQPIRMIVGVRRKEMAMPAADFPDEFGFLREYRGEMSRESLFSLSDDSAIVRSADRILHLLSRRRHCPTRFDQDHQNTDVSRVHSADAARLAQRHRARLEQFLSALLPEATDGKVIDLGWNPDLFDVAEFLDLAALTFQIAMIFNTI
jgi:hypothetical protein